VNEMKMSISYRLILALWRQLGLVKRLHIFEELLKKKNLK